MFIKNKKPFVNFIFIFCVVIYYLFSCLIIMKCLLSHALDLYVSAGDLNVCLHRYQLIYG